jgi:hypothetical protein
LTVVTALHHADIGDYESVKQITSVDADIIRLTYAADVFDGGAEGLFGASQSSGKVERSDRPEPPDGETAGSPRRP